MLVARNTDASWAPLFLLAGAIVVEEGGPLSHAAIVARELGVPAVVNVPGICTRVAADEGALDIRVDGFGGEIVVHPSVPSSALTDVRGGSDRAPAGADPPTSSTGAGVVPARQAPRITESQGAPLGVFVTGLIGAGAIMSALFALTEAVGSKRAERRFDRRARPVAVSASTATIDGIGPTAHAPVGLRPARDHLGLAIVAMLTAVIVAVEASARYLDAPPAGWQTVIWAITLTTSVQVALLGVLAGVAAWRWPDVPLVLRRYWPARHWPRDPGRSLSGPVLWWAIGLAGAFVAFMVVHLWAPAALTPLDRHVYDLMGASSDNERLGPEWLGWFGRPRMVIPMAVGIGIGSLRCRPLSLLFPLSIVVAGTVNVAMAAVVGRRRPPGASDPAALDSFPSGHILTVVLLAGVLPLTVHVMTGRRTVAVLTRLAATTAALVLVVDQVLQGGHWPTDHIAGACLGVAGVLVIHAVVAEPTAHEHCHQCPWSTPSGAPPS